MKNLFLRTALVLGAMAAAGCGNTNMKQIKHLPYPETERGSVTDNYFGVEVADPYRWLEDDRSEATAAWVEAENAVTEDYLAQIPFRGAIRDRLTELWNYPKEGAPSKHGDWWYYYYNDGLQNQSALYRTKRPGEAGELFLDPNTLSEDGTVALAAASFSKDGRYLAYAAAASGSDWVEIRVVDTATGTLTEDRIEWVKNSGATWSPDSKGFYYSAYDAPEKSVYSDQNQFQKVYYHELGTPQSSDRLVYEDKNHPLRYFWAWPSEDGKWLFVCASEGTSGTEVLYRKTSEKNFRTLLPGFDADYGVVTVENDRLYYVTNRDASNYTLRRIDLNRPAKDEVVIPENAKNLLEGVGTAGGYLFAAYLQDAQSRIAQYDFEGKLVREVALPAIGSVSGFGGEKEDKEIYYSLTNYTAPATIYRYDIATGESTLYKAPEVRFDPSLFTTEQVFYPSKDGTQVPMFITRRKDMKLDGKNPCLLYGYGGFQINMTGIQPRGADVRRAGRHLLRGQPARRFGVRRVVAPGRHAREQAECLRRLHRCGRVPDCQQIHLVGQAGDQRRLERRPAGRRLRGAASRPLCCLPAAGRRAGHAALPQVHDRLGLGRGVRYVGERGAVRLYL